MYSPVFPGGVPPSNNNQTNSASHLLSPGQNSRASVNKYGQNQPPAVPPGASNTKSLLASPRVTSPNRPGSLIYNSPQRSFNDKFYNNNLAS
jgi:hypothetical protein